MFNTLLLSLTPLKNPGNMELLTYITKKTKKGFDSFFRLFNLFHILFNIFLNYSHIFCYFERTF